MVLSQDLFSAAFSCWLLAFPSAASQENHGGWELLPGTLLNESSKDVGCLDLESYDGPKLLTKRKMWDYLIDRFLKYKDKPILLRGMAQEWPMMDWGFTGIRSRFGDIPAKIRISKILAERGHTGPTYEGGNLVKDYMDAPPSPNIIFENVYTPLTRAVIEKQNCCKTAGTSESTNEALTNKIHTRPIVSLGHEGSGVAFHQHEENWLAQANGRKVWFLISNRVKAKQITKLRIQPCQYLVKEMPLPVNVKILRCSVSPGDVILVPDKWWHATCNLDHFNIAIGWEGQVENWTPIEHAIADGDLDLLQSIPKDSMKVWFQSPEKSCYILKQVAIYGSRQLMKYMLGKSAEFGHAEDMLVKCKQEHPLYVATEMGHAPIVELLSRDDLSPVNAARRVTHQSPLSHEASNAGHVDVLQILLEKRCELWDTENDKQHALHVAAGSGHLPVMRLLLEYRAEVGVTDTTGKTPLHCAADQGSLVEVAHLLISLGADITARSDGMSPMQMAIRDDAERLSMVEFFIERGAELNAKSAKESSPLHLAAHHGHVGISQLLLRKRASADFTWQSPLEEAIYEGHEAVVDLLVDHGAADKHVLRRIQKEVAKKKLRPRVKAAIARLMSKMRQISKTAQDYSRRSMEKDQEL